MAQTIPEGCLGAVAQEALSPWPLKFEPLTSCGMATQATRNELSEPPSTVNGAGGTCCRPALEFCPALRGRPHGRRANHRGVLIVINTSCAFGTQTI